MTTKRIAIAIAALLAACGSSDKCPTQSPQVSGISPGCTAVAGQPVSYPLRLCPTCNQTGATCVADMSAVAGGDIFLDPTVETCSSSNSCGPSCDPNPLFCNFIAPATPREYRVSVYDPAANTTRVGTLTVIASGNESCALIPSAGL